MRELNIVTLFLTILGGLNLLMIALLNADPLAFVFGAGSSLLPLVHVLVGLSAAWQIVPFVVALSIGQSRAEADLGERRSQP